MKIRINIDEGADEPEIVISCNRLDADIAMIQAALAEALARSSKLALIRDDREYYLPPDEILFFETVDSKTYAHTADETFLVKLKLYELEEILPVSHRRISKSAIVGTRHIYSITRNLTGPSLIRFRDSHKQISVSRSYYKQLINKLSERS